MDEAEMALHPRVQKSLLDYLKRKAIEKKLVVIISTHSITMVKSTDKQHILMLEEELQKKGCFTIVNPCYPAKAIGCVDYIENSIHDAVFFVEDDMARLLLKKMINSCMSDEKYSTVLTCIVPVGGYRETAKLALNTKDQLFAGRTKVFAVWDHDVFTETVPSNSEIKRLLDENRDIIFDLGCTPELWMIEKMESGSEEIECSIRNEFHIEVSSIVNSQEYQRCVAENPRKLAKKKMDVVVQKIASASGDLEQIVIEKFADIMLVNGLSDGDIKRVVMPMLSKIR